MGIERVPIPKETETSVLLLSRRRCAFCFGLDNDVTRKEGQLAHINRKPNDNRQENLAFLCLPPCVTVVAASIAL
jgi:hypothetical protein